MIDDLKFALRRIRNAPGFAAVAILTLALAIGANIAIFSIADAVLFRPLPYKDADKVDLILMRNRTTGSLSTSVSFEYLDALHDNASQLGLSDVGIVGRPSSIVVTGPDGAESVATLAATPNYFQILGVRPHRGRLFNADDGVQGGRAAMLSYESWRKRFGGRDDIVGRPLTFGTKTFDIIGILPPKFMVPALGAKPEVVTVVPPPTRGQRGGAFYPVVRRTAGLTRDDVQPRIDAVTQAISARNPRSASTGPSLREVRSVMFPAGRPIMRWLLVASTLVLLIGCANLANMLLVRSQRNERETGLAMALGASRSRVIRPLLFESAIIGLAGAGLALVVTTAAFDTLLKQVPAVAFGIAPVGIDLRVVLMALGTGLGAGLLFALVPAWRAVRRDVQSLLLARHVRGGKRSGEFGRPMIAVQVTLAVTLIFGAAVTARAFIDVLRVPLGFDDSNVVRVRISGKGLRGKALADHYASIVHALAGRSDIISAGATGRLPFDGNTADEGGRLPGSETTVVDIVHTLPGFFETAGIAPVRGRVLTWSDVSSGPDAAVISETAAQSLFAGQEPLGGIFTNDSGRQFRVVGMVPDIKHSMGAVTRDLPTTYVIPPEAAGPLTILARARGRSDATVIAIKRELSLITPGLPVDVSWWSDSISGIAAYKNPRFQTIVLGSFAVLALGLTALGIFGVVAFLVAMRTREMGVRLAIGATPASLVRLVVRQALLPVGLGVVGGMMAALLLGKLAEAQLFEVKTSDPTTLAAAAATVILAALIAAYLPARRAGRVNPIVVLRSE